MKIESASQFLLVNAVAQRARQLILGSHPRVPAGTRKPAAIAIEELHAGKIEILDEQEARNRLVEDRSEPAAPDHEASEEARAALDRIFGDEDGELAPDETSADDGPSDAEVDPEPSLSTGVAAQRADTDSGDEA